MAFHRFTFGAAVFNQIVRLIVLLYNPSSVYVGRAKALLDLVIFSTRDGKLA